MPLEKSKTNMMSLGRMTIPKRSSEVVLAGYDLIRELSRDDEFALWRARNRHGRSVLVRLPVDERPLSSTLARLSREYALRSHLRADWSALPLKLERAEARLVLVLDDPGGELLETELNRPMAIAEFLRVGIAMAQALGHVHRQGIVHKDVKPANFLLDGQMARAFLSGFGLASRIPRHFPAPNPIEVIEGTLAYIAPEQTGRMNRSIDARSDLYALGVSFYRMLTGSLPFTATEPMEWVHFHLAGNPPWPQTKRPDLPSTLAEIVMKLLAKSSEDRYQTASGLERDLRKCLADWLNTGEVSMFSPGREDETGRLMIPERLYGREVECARLQSALERVLADGSSQLVLVSGYSGIGKSALVGELHKSLVQPRGMFTSGKFDQYRRDIPYSSLGHAFGALVRQILCKNDSEVASWRARITSAVTPNAGLLIALIPELELILGEQPPPAELPPTEAQNRFRETFRRFVGAFAQAEHPLVLFLDDLQWLDFGSLKIFEDLATAPELGHFLLIGAYRDNEVDAAHPLSVTLDAIRKNGVEIDRIELKPLSREILGQLLADSLKTGQARILTLARLLHEKTAGNPFFVLQLLGSLVDEGLMIYAQSIRAWQWDDDRIRAHELSDDVIELMIGKLRRLPETSLGIMRSLACLGSSAPLPILAMIEDKGPEEIECAIEDSLRLGFLFKIDDNIVFAHDRIQEAAYALIPAVDRAELHLKLARLLVGHAKEHEIALDDVVFDLVNQFNRAEQLLEEPEERAMVSRLNAMAGRQAKASGAYPSAQGYLRQAVLLSPRNSWIDDYDESFTTYLALAECDYLNGDMDDAEARFGLLLQNARSKVDSSRAYRTRLRLLQSSGRFPEAKDVALEALRLFGVAYPEGAENVDKAVRQAREEVRRILAGRKIADLAGSPTADDPEILALTGLMSHAIPVFFTTLPALFALHVLKGLLLSLIHGNSKHSCALYASYGLILISAYDEIEDGFAFSELALELNERLNDIEERGRLLFTHGIFVNSWRRPIATSSAILEQAFLSCLEAGNLAYAGNVAGLTGWMLFEQGERLEDVSHLMRRSHAFCKRNRNALYCRVIEIQERFIDGLRGSTVSDLQDSDRLLCEAIADLVGANWTAGLFYLHTSRQIDAFLHDRHEEALAAAREAAPLIRPVMAQTVTATHLFFHALSLAALHDNAPPEQRTAYEDELRPMRARLALWAENCPDNHRCRHLLLEAEMSRLEGRELEAMGLYEQAIGQAMANGFVQHAALSLQLAARFYRSLGLFRPARACLVEARTIYERWGAMAMVRHLESTDPEIGSTGLRPYALGNALALRQLDEKEILKAYHLIAGEIELHRLLPTLLKLVIETAGADRGCLLLMRADELQLAAEVSLVGENLEFVLTPTPIEQTRIAVSVINYVRRSRDCVLLGPTTDPGAYRNDPYFKSDAPRSLLCLPLLREGGLVGILYLENRLASHAFTPDRVATLELLSLQVAVAIENARLYDHLQQENSERRRAEAALEEHRDRLEELVRERTDELTRQKEKLNRALTELELIVGNASLGICTVERRGRGRYMQRVNRGLEQMLGYKRSELEGNSTRKLFPSDQEYRKFAAVYQDVIETGHSYMGELTLRHKSGNAIIVDLVGSALDPENLGRGTIWLLDDITERKRSERALAAANQELIKTLDALKTTQDELIEQEKFASLGSVVAGVAHEVNTPLGVGVTAASLIRHEAGKFIRKFEGDVLRRSDLVQFLDLIKNSSEILETNLQRAVELVRSFKQVATDQSTEETRRIELGAYLGDVIASLRPALKQSGHKVEIVAGEEVWLEAKPSALWQIVSNLVMNSTIHAFEPGQQGLLQMILEKRDDSVVLIYRDNGKGMSSEVRRHIFEPFFTTNRAKGGTGLGLSIVYKLVTASLGGTIACSTAPGRGAEFIITLPL